jgi:plastocyanin
MEKAMLKKMTAVLIVMIASMFLLANCGGKKNGNKSDEEGPKKVAYKETGDEATIVGVIKFDGTPPTPKKIDMAGDPKCSEAGGDKMTDDTVVTDGKLENVFLYLKGGKIDNYSYTTPSTPVELDQKGCRYHPRVMGIMTGQTFQVVNSDPTTHNVHPTPKNNPEWNQSQTQGAPPIEKKFNRAEILVPIKCNQHPWMKAHLGVLGNPFFAVSAKDGAYTIKGVPPGTYTLVAWHETFGEQQMSVTVGAKESKTEDFTYKSGTAYAPTSLKVQPALVVP